LNNHGDRHGHHAVDVVKRREEKVFFTRYAPAVRTPAASALSNALIENPKTMTKAVYAMFTAAEAVIRENRNTS
jgi:hypothetical protein